jgi:ATP-dependent RNA helicase DDX60
VTQRSDLPYICPEPLFTLVLQILSFVYEQKGIYHGVSSLASTPLKLAIHTARQALNRQSGTRLPLSSAASTERATPDQWLIDTSRAVCAMDIEPSIDLPLLFLFIAHCIVLEAASVEDRARPREPLNQKLNVHLCHAFLPLLFRAAESACATLSVPQIDGRVFVSLIRCFIAHRHESLESILGAENYRRASCIWSTISSTATLQLILTDFATRYPLDPDPVECDTTLTAPTRLLPFSNAVFDEYLASVKIVTEDATPSESDVSFPGKHLKFGPGAGTVFADTRHWHNHRKAILPRRLGGEDPKPMTEWQRSKVLKREQRFMATMQRQAGTLTGAFGAILQPIVIPEVGSRHPKGGPPPQVRYCSSCRSDG